MKIFISRVIKNYAVINAVSISQISRNGIGIKHCSIWQHPQFELERTNRTGVLTKNTGIERNNFYTHFWPSLKKNHNFRTEKNWTYGFHSSIDEGEIYTEKNRVFE